VTAAAQPSGDRAFTGSIPELYDRHLGPVIFTPYAQDLAARLRCKPGARVLEIACGTGISTAQVLARLPADGRLVATDLNQAMLDHARMRVAADPRIEWRVADAQQLPFADASFDHCVCQFGVMFFPDKVAALREVRRVLKPGGEFLCNTWGTLQQNDFARLANATVAKFFSSDPPKFYLTPFGWNDEAVIRDTFAAAGLPAVRIDAVERPASSVSAADFAIGLVRGNPIAAAITERLGEVHDRIVAAVAAELARNGGDRPWRGTLRALVIRAEVQ
jgi:SAM-dependent methyltransferase